MRDRSTFENKLMTKDHNTSDAYKTTLDNFEKYLRTNNITINANNAEDVVQSYVNYFSENHSPNSVWNYYTRVKKYLRHLKNIEGDVENYIQNEALEDAKRKYEKYFMFWSDHRFQNS